MSEHTKEPWWACCSRDGSYSHYIFDDSERAICELCSNDPDDARDTFEPLNEILTVKERQANARRIVACVNACAGMDDPAKEIATIQAQRNELLAAAKDAAGYMEDGMSSYKWLEAFKILSATISKIEGAKE